MSTITKQQIRAINATLNRKGLMDQKREIINGASDGRTESSKELTFTEAQSLLIFLNSDKHESVSRMTRKLFAMAYDLRWIGSSSYIDGDQVQSKKDYSMVYEWVKKYGYLRKELREYSSNELPKLLSQFELGPYAHYLKR